MLPKEDLGKECNLPVLVKGQTLLLPFSTLGSEFHHSPDAAI
jgi:hypothetical protein